MSLLAGASSLFIRSGGLTTCQSECCATQPVWRRAQRWRKFSGQAAFTEASNVYVPASVIPAGTGPFTFRFARCCYQVGNNASFGSYTAVPVGGVEASALEWGFTGGTDCVNQTECGCAVCGPGASVYRRVSLTWVITEPGFASMSGTFIHDLRFPQYGNALSATEVDCISVAGPNNPFSPFFAVSGSPNQPLNSWSGFRGITTYQGQSYEISTGDGPRPHWLACDDLHALPVQAFRIGNVVEPIGTATAVLLS